jgi:hypothetical protein
MIDSPFLSFLVTLPSGSQFVYGWDTVLDEAMGDEMWSDLRRRVEIEQALAISD